jgi:hypothetical protein
MPLESLFGPRVTSAIAYVVAALTLFSLLYGAAKVAWTKVTGKPFPHNALTRQLDALAELGSNIIGAINKLSPSPLIANPEVLRRDAMLAEVRAQLADVTARLPSADPVAPALPTPAEPARVLRAPTLTGRESMVPPEVSDEHFAAARAVVHAEIGAPSKPSQSGHVEGGAMLGACIVALAASLMCTGCPPPPPADGGVPVVTPSDWTRTARLSVTIGRGLIVVARPIVETLAVDPGRTRARRAFDAADQALAGLDRALVAYEARGGDRCVAYAATGAAIVTLHELAQVLADNGIALGVPLARVVDLVASVADTLIPACQSDAGFASVGGRSDATLRAIETAARARGVILRRDLDGIAPALDGGL